MHRHVIFNERHVQLRSVFYGADEYLDELKKKFEVDHEIAAMKGILPDEGAQGEQRQSFSDAGFKSRGNMM